MCTYQLKSSSKYSPEAQVQELQGGHMSTSSSECWLWSIQIYTTAHEQQRCQQPCTEERTLHV